MLDTLLNRPGSASDAFLTGLARRLHAAGLNADALTYAALGCGVLGGTFFYLDHGWMALLAILVSGALDAVEGQRHGVAAAPRPVAAAA